MSDCRGLMLEKQEAEMLLDLLKHMLVVDLGRKDAQAPIVQEFDRAKRLLAKLEEVNAGFHGFA